LVVLPLGFKYKQDIFHAVITACLENQSGQNNNSDDPSWTGLFESVKQSLGRKLSPRDFRSHVENMTNDGMLFKNDSGKRGTRISISLTEKAKKLNNLGILGQSKQEESNKKILQLLIFFHLVKPPKLISATTLDKILSSLSLSQRDLGRHLESHFHHLDTRYTETNYKPIKDYKFRIVEVYDKGRKTTRYFCKRISFSIEDILKYTKKYKKVAIDNTRVFPFIKQIKFPKITEGEIKKGFDILRRENIIRPTQNIFDESGKQVAFLISDDDLRDLINQIWRMRNLELERLHKKLTYLEGPTKEEKEWLELTYGSNQASIIIHGTSHVRNEMRNRGNSGVTHIKTRIESLEDRIDHRALGISKAYRKVIKKFDFQPDILEGICLNKISLT
jgi:hypothetical protein